MGTPITERPRTAFVVTARHAAQRAEFAKTAALFTRVNQQVLKHAQGVDEAEALPLTFTNASSKCQRLLSLVLFAAGHPIVAIPTAPAVGSNAPPQRRRRGADGAQARRRIDRPRPRLRD